MLWAASMMIWYKLVLICRTLYRQALEPDCFLDKTVMEAAYPDRDYSVTYVAIGDFVYLQDRYGQPYGWGVAH